MSTRPSFAQIEALVEFLEQNPGIAKGLLRTNQAKLETKRKWADIAITLNALGGANKDGQGWAKYWAEKKCALKKQCAQLSASIRSTGGGLATNLPVLSAIDNRLVAVMGGQEFATRDESITVNPFPNQTRPISPVLSRSEVDTEDIIVCPAIPSTSQTISIIPPAITPPHHSTQLPLHSIPLPQQTTSPPHQSTQPPHQSTQPPHHSTPPPHHPTPPPPHHPTPPPPQEGRVRRRRSAMSRASVDADMDRFARIEERRVEAEAVTAQAFARMSEQMASVANALTLIASGLMEIARKIPEP